MKRKIFFRQSGFHWFYIVIDSFMVAFCVFGVIYVPIDINEEPLMVYGGMFGGIFGFFSLGFDLLRRVRQVVFLNENEIYVPAEWHGR